MLRQRFAERFAQRTRAEWAEVFADLDACVTPVLSPAEAPAHPHNRARGTFVEVGGETQPAPAPRFARTPAAAPRPARPATVAEILAGWSASAASGYAVSRGSKIRQLDVAWAIRRPRPSVIRASASAVRRPRCSTAPWHLIRPVATVTGRRNFTFRSSEV